MDYRHPTEMLDASKVDSLCPQERTVGIYEYTWPAPGSEDTELGVLMELEVDHGEAEVYA